MIMNNYHDNWERLVTAVLRREELRRVAMSPSINSSIVSSLSSSFRSSVSIDQSLVYEDTNNNGQQTTSNFYYEDYSFEDVNGLIWDRFFQVGSHNGSALESLNITSDEKTGKKCIMLGAKVLDISLGNNPKNWNWTFDPDFRFSEVAELISNWRLDIRGTIPTKSLDPWTVYAAYLVFKTTARIKGLESAKTVIRFVDDESDRDSMRRAQTVHLQPVEDCEGRVASSRSDGWMEIEMGHFYVSSRGDEGSVEARLLEIKKWKSGLIVGGIMFRPTNLYTEDPVFSKQFLATNVWG